MAEDRRKRVRLSFDVDERLRRRVRLAAVNRDVTVTELLTAMVEKGLGTVETGSDSAERG